MKELSFVRPKRYEKTGEGLWTPGAASRVILKSGEASWEEIAACVNLLGEEYPVLAAAAQLRDVESMEGDLVIRVGQPEELAGIETFQEGFAVRVGGAVEIVAQSLRAVMYGLRTVCEHVQAGALERGLLVDWPDTNERGLHLDAGRKFYTKEWIIARIRDLSRNRMNVLWLHFSENEGFRIASDRHPELPSLQHLSKDDVREIIRAANAYHVDLNPALD